MTLLGARFFGCFSVVPLAAVLALFFFGACTAGAGAGTHSMFNRNLVVNGDFEDALGSLDIDHVVKPNGWSTSGNFTVVQYGGLDGLPLASQRGTGTHGQIDRNFFAGGPGSAESHAWQLIDLRPEESAIRTGNVRYVLAGYLGGRRAKADYAQIWVRFLDKRKNQLCTDDFPCHDARHDKNVVAWFGPAGPRTVTRADREGITGFQRVSCTDFVPSAARYALIAVSAYRESGYDNHGYADDISFVLSDDRMFGSSELWCHGRVDDHSAQALQGITSHVADPDVASSPCVEWQLGFIWMILAFLVGSIIAMIALPAPVQGVLGPPAAAIKQFLRLDVPHPRVATGLLIGAATFWWLSRLTELFHIPEAGCALRAARVPVQTWALPAVVFLLLFSFVVLASAVVFFHAGFLHPESLPRSVIVRIDILIIAFVIGLGFLGALTPSSDIMERIDTALLIVATAIGYLWLSMRSAIRKFEKALRWGIFALLLVPIVQPAIALWNLQAIKIDRVLHESEHRYFDVSGGRRLNDGRLGERDRFSDVLLYSPSSMDEGESARVVFSAHVLSSDRTSQGCLIPRFRAPGFAIQEVFVDAIPPGREDVRWEWILTPTEPGRQFMYVNVLYSETCKPYDAKNSDLANGFSTLFSQSDSVWVSTHWFALINLASTLPWLGVAAAIVSALVDVFDWRPRPRPADQGTTTTK